MRLVDVRNIKSVATIYSHIPQPMYVYHSVEEFENNALIKHTPAMVQPYTLIKGMGDYYEFLHKNKINTDYDPDNVYVDLRKYNVWIKTVDTFVPETADAQGNITYKGDADGNSIPTDGVYIKLYFLTPTPSRHVLYTSSGLHTVGMSKWDMTGAERYSFLQEKLPATKGEGYQNRLAKMLRTKRPTVKFMKLAMALMVSDSDSFLDIDKAVRVAFGQSIKKADRMKLLESPASRSSLMSTLKTLFPDLAPAIRKNHSPEDMAKMLATMYGIAEEDKNIEKMMRVFDKIKEVGYEEHTIINEQMPSSVPLIAPTGNNNQLTDGKTTIQLPDYTKAAEETKEKVEQELEEIKENLDYPNSYVQPERKGKNGDDDDD